MRWFWRLGIGKQIVWRGFVWLDRICVRLRHHDKQQILQIIQQIVKFQDAAALYRSHIADGQKPRQPAPAKTRRGISNDIRRTIGKDQPGTSD